MSCMETRTLHCRDHFLNILLNPNVNIPEVLACRTHTPHSHHPQTPSLLGLSHKNMTEAGGGFWPALIRSQSEKCHKTDKTAVTVKMDDDWKPTANWIWCQWSQILFIYFTHYYSYIVIMCSQKENVPFSLCLWAWCLSSMLSLTSRAFKSKNVCSWEQRHQNLHMVWTCERQGFSTDKI